MKTAVRDFMLRTLPAAIGLLWCLQPVFGATLERLSFEDMVRQSTQILRGRVAGSHAAFRGDVIYSFYRIDVLQRWKGPEANSLEVMVPGGAAQGFRQTYSGAPQLESGKEYVLFLWAGKDGANQVIGFTQGVFQLPATASGQKIARRPATAELMLSPQTGRPVQDEPLEMPLRTLDARIRAILGKASTR